MSGKSTDQVQTDRIVGRPKILPVEAQERILQHRSAGLGYGRIARELRNTSPFDVSRWTIRRVVLGLSPYEKSVGDFSPRTHIRPTIFSKVY